MAYDLTGAAYAGGGDFFSRGPVNAVVFFQRSDDNGMTWSGPVIAVYPYFAGGVAAKPWMQIDTNPGSPRRNTIYISTVQGDLGCIHASQKCVTEITVSHSTDRGQTWATVPIGARRVFPKFNCCGDLAIGRDGTVYNSWIRCLAILSTGCPDAAAFLSKSTDGGNTWSKESLIHHVHIGPDNLPGCNGYIWGCLPNKPREDAGVIPVIAIDNGTGPNVGTLYEVDDTFVSGYLKVEVTASKDGGATWSPAVSVAPKSDRHDQFFPWINVSNIGAVGVTWLDRRNDPANVSYDAFAAVSIDGGKTFPNYQLSAKPSNPLNDGFGGKFMGDYTGNTWAGKSLYAAWPDTSNGVNAQDVVGGLRMP